MPFLAILVSSFPWLLRCTLRTCVICVTLRPARGGWGIVHDRVAVLIGKNLNNRQTLAGFVDNYDLIYKILQKH